MDILSSTANWGVKSVKGDVDAVGRWWLKCPELKAQIHLPKTSIKEGSRFAPATIFYSLYSLNLLTFIWQFYLSYRQYRVHLLTENRPLNVSDIISEEDYKQARLYNLDKHRLGFVQKIVGQIAILLILLTNFTAYLWHVSGNITSKYYGESEIVQSLLFCFIQSVLDIIISTPFSYYESFVIEEKFGINKQTRSSFFVNRVKKFVVSLALGAPIICATIWIIKSSGPHFFVYVWIFISFVTFAMMTVYSEFIDPLFHKYTLLPESDLKAKIEKLAKKVEFPLNKLYVVEGSKQSLHSNAYMYGFWKNIVLCDNLLSPEMNEQLKVLHNLQTTEKKADESTGKNEKKPTEMNDDEVVAMLSHELGHWKFMHALTKLVIIEVNLFLVMIVFSYFYKNSAVYQAFGFDSQPVLVGLTLILQYILAPYNEVMSIAMSLISRYVEFSADKFSVELGYASLLISGLVKLSKDNLRLPIDDWLYSTINHSHLPAPERISALNKYL